MLRPQWHFLSEEPPTDIVELLLAQRGLEGAERDAFLHPSLDQLHDPFGLPDMEKAVAKLEWARTWQQPVTVFGDYDCDGVTSTVLLYSLLKQAGMQVAYHVPHRIDDGYGLTEAGVEKVHARGSRLIVTVDVSGACVRTSSGRGSRRNSPISCATLPSTGRVVSA